MSVTWQHWSSFWRNSSNLKTGWMVAAVIAALYVGAVRPYQAQYGINNSRGTGLAADKTEPLHFWRQTGYLPRYGVARDRQEQGGIVGGDPDVIGPARAAKPREMMMATTLAPAAPPPPKC